MYILKNGVSPRINKHKHKKVKILKKVGLF
jgi:hypothetical protein